MSDSANTAFGPISLPIVDTAVGFQEAEDARGEVGAAGAPRRVPSPDDVPREPLAAREHARGSHWRRRDMQNG